MNVVIFYCRVALFSMKLSIQRQLESPTFLLIWMIINPVQYFVGLLLLQTVVAKAHSLGGWSKDQLALLYGVGLISHGLMVTFFIQSWHFDELVQRGQFDRFLVRPLGLSFQLFCMSFNLIGLSDLAVGIVIVFIAAHSLHLQFTIYSTIQLFFMAISAMFLRSSIYLMIGSFAFWTFKSQELSKLGQIVLERSTLYPISIYPVWIQIVLTFLCRLLLYRFILRK